VSVSLQTFRISRTTFCKWQRKSNPNNLRSFEDEPGTSKTERVRILSFTEKQALKRFREKYIRQAKVKLSVMYKKEYGIKYRKRIHT